MSRRGRGVAHGAPCRPLSFIDEDRPVPWGAAVASGGSQGIGCGGRAGKSIASSKDSITCGLEANGQGRGYLGIVFHNQYLFHKFFVFRTSSKGAVAARNDSVSKFARA